jgi:hypothetical protein
MLDVREGMFKNLLVLAAALAMAAGIVSTLLTLRQKEAMVSRLDHRIADLKELEEMQATLSHDQAVVDALVKAGKRFTESLPDYFKTALSNETVNIRDLGTQPAVAGWVVRRTAVDISDIRMDKLMPVLAELERSRPPWRVAECSLRASRSDGLYGEAKLVLEHLENTQ